MFNQARQGCKPVGHYLSLRMRWQHFETKWLALVIVYNLVILRILPEFEKWPGKRIFIYALSKRLKFN